ncbi:MAG: TIGR04282 family arsenosugar biosynthesis glycosyltransferase [Saprospiraceae bacterium]|nr:TIGR04282 family arsenosugar biosynthesis glycosyltransferase [Saprospiraceae bacterium]
MPRVDNALLIFVRNPQKGQVKTRLARTLGEEAAYNIYLQLLAFTRQVALAVEAKRLVFYSHFIDPNDQWTFPDFEKHLQAGDPDLGARMEAAFQLALSHYDKAVIIGSDCIQLSPAILESAFAALDAFPYVLGPAHDGGYYLLGMSKPTPSLFSDIPWSTPTVAAETLSRIDSLGASSFVLPTLSDIDEAEDWEKYGQGNWMFDAGCLMLDV